MRQRKSNLIAAPKLSNAYCVWLQVTGVVGVCFMTGSGLQRLQTYLIGSFHMSSHASSHWASGSERMTGISRMAESRPPPWQGRGIPPWVQNICQLRVSTSKSILHGLVEQYALQISSAFLFCPHPLLHPSLHSSLHHISCHFSPLLLS